MERYHYFPHALFTAYAFSTNDSFTFFSTIRSFALVWFSALSKTTIIIKYILLKQYNAPSTLTKIEK